jgi:hypothetical protein
MQEAAISAQGWPLLFGVSHMRLGWLESASFLARATHPPQYCPLIILRFKKDHSNIANLKSPKASARIW